MTQVGPEDVVLAAACIKHDAAQPLTVALCNLETLRRYAAPEGVELLDEMAVALGQVRAGPHA